MNPQVQRETGTRSRVAWAIFGILVVVTLLMGGPSFGSAGGQFTAWLTEVRREDGDRGWDRLESSIQHAYGDDRDAYLAEVERIDWDQFRVEDPVERWTDDGFARVEAALTSAPGSVPAFLFDRRMIHAICDESGQPTAIGAYEDRRLFAGGRFSGGGTTGSQARCQTAFRAFGDP